MPRHYPSLSATLYHFLLELKPHVSYSYPFSIQLLKLTIFAYPVFWSWFPLSTCGFRTLLLFFSSLAVFVLRVGQMHTGARITSSPFATWKETVFSFSVVQTFGWYIFSAWWFSEVYIWSSSEGADLNWVKPGRFVFAM